MTAPLQQVHVRVNDAATGKPTPVLVCFSGPDGTYYPPFGRLAKFATEQGEDVGGNLLLGDRPYSCIDGSCEVLLPPGTVWVRAFKGPEYQPLVQEVVLQPGKLALRLDVKRWTDFRQEGWYSGDTHAYFLTPHAALLEAAATDLAVVNLLACYRREESRPAAIPNILAFSGQQPALERPGHMVVVNTLNEHPILGRLALLNCHRSVYPLYFGGPSEFDDWTLADWCDQCHRKAGLVVALECFSESGWKRSEFLADLILGKIDALDATPAMLGGYKTLTTEFLQAWYQLLNLGFRLPLVAGSGKDSNRCSLGELRTFARLAPAEAFSYKNWIEAVRAGRTFVSGRILLSFTANDVSAGAVLDLPTGAQTVRVQVEAGSTMRCGQLEVLCNGNVVADASWREPAGSSPLGPVYAAMVEADIPITHSGWLAARCRYGAGDTKHFIAHSSPVYVQRDRKPLEPETAAAAFLFAYIDTMLEWVAHHGRFVNDQQRERLAGVFHSARAVLEKRCAATP